MKIGKASVMNYKVTGVMATDFDKAISYIKKCVATIRTTPIKLPAVNTDI